MGKLESKRAWPVAAAGCVCFAAMVASADIAPPAWVNDAGVISVKYRFETGATEPGPSESANLFGAPYMLIDKVTQASGGWIDPDGYAAEFITRGNAGAWEIGENGYMQVILPLLGAESLPGQVDFFIEVIAAQGIEVLPLIEVEGASNPFRAQEVIEPDPLGMFSWVQQVATGQVDLVSMTDLRFRVTCYDTTPYGDASTIDQVMVYARVIPEPAAMGLVVLAAGLALAAHRIFSAGV